MIYVRVGVYHDTEPLCPVKESAKVDHTNPKWDEWVDLELPVPDIPRSAKLCLSICSVKVYCNVYIYYHRLILTP